MKTHTRAKKIIEALAVPVRSFLKLDEWELEHSYMDGTFPDNDLAALTIDVNIPYLRASVRIWDAAYSLPEAELKHAYIHEMCHIYTENLYSIARANASPHLHPFIEEQREQLTEKIARLVDNHV
jgi:hypothetical protein